MSISLITPAELTSLLSRVVLPVSIVDARTRQEFEAGHIPGAVHVDWEQWNELPPPGTKAELWEPGYWGSLDNPWKADFSTRLSALGLSNEKTIVVYADGVTSKGREGRIAWMLLYLGASNVCLLNGGWQTWLNAGGEYEVNQSDTIKADFQIRLDHRRRVTLDRLGKACLKGDVLNSVDTRSVDEFDGHTFDYQVRTGHIPKAVRLGYESLFEGEYEFASAESLLQNARIDLISSPGAFTYCEVGVRASTYALLTEILTGTIVPVYDGSVVEWGVYKELPLIRQ